MSLWHRPGANRYVVCLRPLYWLISLPFATVTPNIHLLLYFWEIKLTNVESLGREFPFNLSFKSILLLINILFLIFVGVS